MAQLVERVLWEHEVAGSIPVTQTIDKAKSLKLARIVLIRIRSISKSVYYRFKVTPHDVVGEYAVIIK